MPKVFIMLSGGVDSSVAAARLIDSGFEVEAVFMKNWSYDRLSLSVAEKLAQNCPTQEDALSAKAAAEHLGIPFRVVNFEKEYWDKVVEPFFKQYAEGLTPNPDIWCNQFIKFEVFLDWALRNGADLVATGHYARLETSRGKVRLLRGVDPAKDQSYFLSRVSPEKLKIAVFPIGHLYKSQVRAEAFARGLPTANKKDSQGICFIGKIAIKEFLKERLPEKSGDVVYKGEVIGHHEGAWFYTIGQRHIGYSAIKSTVKGQDPKPLYVVDKDVSKNLVFVDEENVQEPLWKRTFKIKDLIWFNRQSVSSKMRFDIEIRYHQTPRSKGSIKGRTVELVSPARAVTPGQTVVFSQGDEIFGSAIIT